MQYRVDQSQGERPRSLLYLLPYLESDYLKKNGFSNYFGNTCKPNTQSYNELKFKEFNDKLVNYFGDILTCDELLTVELVCKVICELKTGRASGLDGVTTEHLLYCHPSVHLLITILSNLIFFKESDYLKLFVRPPMFFGALLHYRNSGYNRFDERINDLSVIFID